MEQTQFPVDDIDSAAASENTINFLIFIGFIGGLALLTPAIISGFMSGELGHGSKQKIVIGYGFMGLLCLLELIFIYGIKTYFETKENIKVELELQKSNPNKGIIFKEDSFEVISLAVINSKIRTNLLKNCQTNLKLKWSDIEEIRIADSGYKAGNPAHYTIILKERHSDIISIYRKYFANSDRQIIDAFKKYSNVPVTGHAKML